MSATNLQQPNESIIQVWSNQLDSTSFKAFLSTLSLSNIRWQVGQDYSSAHIWCLVDIEVEGNQLSERYLNLLTKPKVVCLGSSFVSPPIAEWVFFKAPINRQALNNWLTKHHFLHNPYQANASSVATHASPQSAERWRVESFKLQFWPNVSNYTDSPEIVQVCSMLMRDWTSYATLLTSNLPETTIRQLLMDAEAEENLIYLPSSSTTTAVHTTETAPKAQTLEQKDSAWGFFKGLFSRFVK